jgi:SOS-response transcriptional repressor LexA
MNETEEHPLTESQARILYEICRYVRTHKKQPTIKQIAQEVNLSSNAACYMLTQLKKNGYIKSMPNSNSWEIVKWFDQSMGCYAPVMGYLYDGEPVMYGGQSIGKVWLPIQVKNLKGMPDDIFVLLVKSRRANCLPMRTRAGDLAVFQCHKSCYSGSIVLAIFNGRLGLFRYLPSRTQAILTKGKSAQGGVPIRSQDEWNVLATLLMPFSKSEMQLL